MESTLSISSENVVFQESDNLFIDYNPFKYVAPYGKKADIWMDPTILARTFSGQLQGYDLLQNLWKYPALGWFSPTFWGVIIIVDILMFTWVGQVGNDSLHSSSVEFAAKCCTTGVCFGHGSSMQNYFLVSHISLLCNLCGNVVVSPDVFKKGCRKVHVPERMIHLKHVFRNGWCTLM